MLTARDFRIDPMPREILDALWWKFMGRNIAKMVAIKKGLTLDSADLEVKLFMGIRRFKYWADLRHAKFGVYPDIAVSNFLRREGFLDDLK